jgi:hypothetical protein
MDRRQPPFQGRDIFARIESSIGPGQSIPVFMASLDPPISKGTAYGWKEKNIIPKTWELYRIAEKLNAPLYWLLTGEKEADLPEDQQKLLENFENLDDQGKKLALDQIEGLLKHFPRRSISANSTAG